MFVIPIRQVLFFIGLTRALTHALTRVMARTMASALVVVSLLILSPNAFAQDANQPSAEERGQINIIGADLYESLDGWRLSASVEVQLSREMRQGLNSGVPLQFIVNVRIKRLRKFILDKTLVEHQQRYILNYYELTRHYHLESITTGEGRNFRSLIAALDELGRLTDIEVPKPASYAQLGSKESEQRYASLNFRLDDKALPLPLQPLLSSRWKLASEDFAWSLN